MKKTILICICGFLGLMSLSALDIARDELEKDIEEIEFVNYIGPHEFINTWQEIIAIGTYLGESREPGFGSNYWNKYRIIAVGDQGDEEGRFSADIFVIEPSALVDHIINIQGMLAGYLVAAYGYTFDEAILLSRFITYYNAAFRGNMEYLEEHYTGYVMEHLDADNAGIDTHYSEWAGKTRILIPLRTSVLDPERVLPDTMELTNDQVIEQMQEEEDQGIDDRQQMVELREAENIVDAEIVEVEEQRIEEEEARIEEERQQLEEGTHPSQLPEPVVEEVPEEPEPVVEEVPEEPEPVVEEVPEEPEPVVEQVLEEPEPVVVEPEPEVEEEPVVQETPEEAVARLDEEEAQLEEDRELLAAATEDLEVRDADVMEEREVLAEEIQEVIDEEPEAVVYEPIPLRLLKVVDSDNGIPLSAFIVIDERTGEVIQESEINTIRGRDYLVRGEELIVVAGREGGNKAIRLARINPYTLEIVTEGTDRINAGSMFCEVENDLYVVTGDEDGWYLGRFSSDLELLARTEEPVYPESFLYPTSAGIYAQTPEGVIVLLDLETLTVIEQDQ